MNLYVFDDRTADGWAPFALTRPCGDLRFGDRLLRQRIERFAGRSTAAMLSRSWLGKFHEPGSVPMLDRNAAPAVTACSCAPASFLPTVVAGKRPRPRGLRCFSLATRWPARGSPPAPMPRTGDGSPIHLACRDSASSRSTVPCSRMSGTSSAATPSAWPATYRLTSHPHSPTECISSVRAR